MPPTAARGVQSTQPAVQTAAATPFAPTVTESRLVITLDAITTVNFPAPATPQDDYTKIEIYSATARAHVLSFGANKLNGNKTSATWTKAVAGKIGEILAVGGVWYFTGGIADANAFAQQVTLA